MWKKPQRPNNEITQTFSDGVVKIYKIEDVSKPGYQPVKAPVYKGTLRFRERRVGIQRFYSGKQSQVDIERVLRVPRVKTVSSQDIAVTDDGRQYSIEQVQTVDGVYPPSIDLTLKRVTHDYDLTDGGGAGG